MRRQSVSVIARVDLDDIDESDLVEELRSRGFFVGKKDSTKSFEPASVVVRDEIARVREAVQRGFLQDAVAALDRLLEPKFKTPAACLEAYEQRKAAH